MRKHSKEFKEKIALLGKEQSIQISFGETVLSNSEINEVYRIVNGNILKSVMREIEIDSNVEIPLKTQINVKYGILVNEEYEYLNLGNFIVNKVERQEDTYSYLIKCYDKMLYTMQDYKTPNVLFPVTIKQYITGLCENLGLVFKQRNYEFTNSDKILQTDPYENIGYKYRDVFDDLAEVIASTICVNEDDDELELRDITDAKYTNTLQGTFLTLTDSKEDTIKVNRILGDSTQETEPTPDAPVEVETVGDNENLLDLSSIHGTTVKNGVTITVDKDKGSVTYNGTCTTAFVVDIFLKEVLPIGTVVSMGAYNSKTTSNVSTVIRLYSAEASGVDKNVHFNIAHNKLENYAVPVSINKVQLRLHQNEVYDNFEIFPKLVIGSKLGAFSPYGMGSIEVKVSNANLVDFSKYDKITTYTTYNFENNIATIECTDGTYRHIDWELTDIFLNNPGKTIRFHRDNLETIGDVTYANQIEYTKDGTKKYLYNSNGIFSIPSDLTGVSVASFCIYINNSNTAKQGTLKITKPRLTFAENSEYVPHQSQKLPIYLDREYCKIDDYQDYLYKDLDEGKWYKHKEILKIVLDENSPITYQGTNTSGLYRYLIYVADNYGKNVKKCDLSNSKAYCNRLSLLGNGLTYSCRQGFTVNNNILYIYTDGSSLTDFKTYLAENPMTFYIPLETPIEEEITDTVLIEQYDKLLELQAYNDLTHISSDGMAILDVTYTTEFEEIDEHYLKDVNVNFGKKYGKINSLVLSRSESDNIYRKDNKSIEENGLNELKISDNVIMNNNNRSDYIDAIFNKINGLEYYLNDFTSTGLMYLDLLDRYKVNIGEKQYSCVLLNNEQNISQGLEELIFTEEPETTVTDYSKADKTDLKINQTNLIVDKQGQQIQGLITNVTDISEKQTEITATVEGLTTKVSDIEDVTKQATGIKTITLENCVAGTLLELQIKGNNTVFERLYPNKNLFVGNNVFPKGDSRVKVTSGENIDIYDLGVSDVLRQNGTVYDEYILSEGIAQVIRRIDSSGNILANPTVSVLGEFGIQLYEGTNIIEIVNYEASMTVTYAIKNAFTDVFATKVDMSSKIESTAQEINLEVRKKVDENEIISKINLSAESASINANRVSLKRKSY